MGSAVVVLVIAQLLHGTYRPGKGEGVARDKWVATHHLFGRVLTLTALLNLVTGSFVISYMRSPAYQWAWAGSVGLGVFVLCFTAIWLELRTKRMRKSTPKSIV